MAIADRVVVMNQGRIEQVAQPPELYEAPATPFSATFVGSRNALELPVRDRRVSLGSAFSVPAPADANSVAVAFFRPEDVEVHLDGSGQPASVEVKIFLGPTTRLHLATQVDDGRVAYLHADLPSRQAAALQPGSRLGIRVDPAHVRVFTRAV
jgi:putative spermidine/putrescine transport system ATP-binding protein